MTLEEKVEMSGRDAFLLKPAPLPVLSGGNARSFFGGLPFMPPGTPWPHKEIDSRMEPLAFVAQVQLEDLPPLDGSPLPRRGSLCFFKLGGQEWLDPEDVAVLYFDQPFESLVQHDSPWLLDEGRFGPWFWMDRAEVTSYPLDKYPIEFFRFRSYANYVDESDSPDYAETCEALQRTSLMALAALSASTETTWEFGADADDWPFAWSVVEHATRALLVKVEWERRFSTIPAEVQALLPDIEAWRDRARKQSPLDLPGSDARSGFRRSWSEWQEIIGVRLRHAYRLDLPRYLAEAIRLTACLLADRHSPEVIPERFREAIDSEWVLRLRRIMRYGKFGMTQMLGYGEAVQSTPVDRIDDVLLLQVKYDVYRSWWPDSGDDFCVVQFWISPEDLRARRFDRVEANLDCT